MFSQERIQIWANGFSDLDERIQDVCYTIVCVLGFNFRFSFKTKPRCVNLIGLDMYTTS